MTIKDFNEAEKFFHFFIIDLFAREYGWSIEYIQNLELYTIAGLLKAIKFRKDNEDMFAQININKGFAGKVSPNRKKTSIKKESEVENLKSLAKMLGEKVNKVDK
jgi:hypothetical protein